MTVAMVGGGDREGSSVLHLIWPEQRVQTLINHSKIQIIHIFLVTFIEDPYTYMDKPVIKF